MCSLYFKTLFSVRPGETGAECSSLSVLTCVYVNSHMARKFINKFLSGDVETCVKNESYLNENSRTVVFVPSGGAFCCTRGVISLLSCGHNKDDMHDVENMYLIAVYVYFFTLKNVPYSVLKLAQASKKLCITHDCIVNYKYEMFDHFRSRVFSPYGLLLIAYIRHNDTAFKCGYLDV